MAATLSCNSKSTTLDTLLLVFDLVLNVPSLVSYELMLDLVKWLRCRCTYMQCMLGDWLSKGKPSAICALHIGHIRHLAYNSPRSHFTTCIAQSAPAYSSCITNA